MALAIDQILLCETMYIGRHGGDSPYYDPLEGSEHADQTLRCTKQKAPGWGVFCVVL
jgi:hypothetical protein